MRCCESYPSISDQQFTAERVKKELETYRRKGPGPTARMLSDGLVSAGLARGSLIDIGAGFGALTMELLEQGMDQAVVIEASTAYLTAAETEVTRRGMQPRVRFVHADFVGVGDLAAASVVVLDRVICCYPYYEPFLSRALDRAERALAYSYPRDRWFVRAGLAFENARRPRACRFRAFVHPPDRMQQIIERAGFRLASRASTLMWRADVFARSTATT